MTDPCGPLPQVDEAALVFADQAFLFGTGSEADLVRAAVRAYLWAVENIATYPDGMRVYPSTNDYQIAHRQDVEY